MSSTVATQLPTGTWSIDPVHSSIGFGVKHLRCLDVPRQLHRRSGSAHERDGAITAVEGTVRVENVRPRSPSSRATCTARTSSTGRSTRRSRSRARRSSRPMTTSSASRATSRSAASRSRSSSTQSSRASATAPTATRASASPPAARSTAATGASSGTTPLANGALAVAERVTIQLHVEAVKV